MKKITVILLYSLLSSGCDNQKITPSEKKNPGSELNAYLQAIKSNVVYIKGGVFEMGDFGEKLYGGQIDPYPDSKPLHSVELTSFSMSKFKISNRDYYFYINYNGLPGREVRDALKKRWNEHNSTPETPARIDWYEANNYCGWLGKVTGLPFSLPTEAQWEFAARSRGKFLVLPTSTGKAEIESHRGERDRGINISTSYDRQLFARKNGTQLEESSSMPGDAFPPNPLGIYDMAANGFEWVSDWYDPEYYKNSPLKDPTGPEKPGFQYREKGYQKVMRSSNNYNGIVGSTVGRTYRSPRVPGDSIPHSQTARCVVNSPNPIK